MTIRKIPISYLPIIFFSAFTLGFGLCYQFLFLKPPKSNGFSPPLYCNPTKWEPSFSLKNAETQAAFQPSEVPIKRGTIHYQQRLGATSISPDDSQLAASTNSAVVIFDIATGQKIRTIPTNSPTQIVAYSPEGDKLLIWGENHTWTLVNPETGKTLYSLPAPSVTYTGDKRTYFSPDAKYLIALAENQVRLYELSTGKLHKTIHVPQTTISSIDVSADSQFLITASLDGNIHFFDMNTGMLQKQRTLTTPNQELITHVGMSPTSDYVLAQTASSLILFDVKTGKLENSFPLAQCLWNHENSFSVDGQKITFLQENYNFPIQVYDMKNKKQHGFQGDHPVWSQDGKVLAFIGHIQGKKTIHLLNAETLEEVSVLTNPFYPNEATSERMPKSYQSTILASGKTGMIMIRDLKHPSVIHTIQALDSIDEIDELNEPDGTKLD